jgi:hypothetical protein
MTKAVQEALLPLLNEQDAAANLLNYVDPATTILLPETDLEVVRIQRDVNGNVMVATTHKLPNLRFRLGDLLLEAVSSGVTAAGSLGQPLRLIVAALRFLRTLHKLSAIEIERTDAELLVAIFRLAQEREQVRVDDLAAMLPGWEEAQIALSLERLDLLACIELRMDSIVLNETILVQQKDDLAVV